MEYSSGTRTILCTDNKEEEINSKKEKGGIRVIKLKLPRRVTWTEDTIDNEHMNQKKSKSK